jgi:hypothetical protein
MNTNELIAEVFTDIESGKFERANNMLADDFRALLLGKEVNRPIYISALRSLRQGIIRSFPLITRFDSRGSNSYPFGRVDPLAGQFSRLADDDYQ